MDLEYEYSQNELEKTLEFLCIIKNIYIDLSKRNFEIDNLPDYLTTLTKETIDNFQYVKHKLFLVFLTYV